MSIENADDIKIVIYPDRALLNKALDVSDFKDQNFLNVVSLLKNNMDQYGHCVGLAANQIASNLNVFVADASKNKREVSKYGSVVVVNAQITSHNGIEQKREGCMSVPDLTVDIHRYESIQVRGFNLYGEEVKYDLSGFEARVFQHEIDHLKGKVILDRAKSSRDIFVRKNYRK